MPVSTIVGDKEVAQMREQMNKLDSLKPEIERAKRAGLDVGDAERQMEDSRRKLSQMLAAYAPGQV